MSSLFGQHNGGLFPSDEQKKTSLLPDVLSGTSFLTANGRVYRLFGNENEEAQQSLPDIPPIPPLLAAPKAPVLSLEEAFQQIEKFSSQAIIAKPKPVKPIKSVQTDECVLTKAESPTLQLFQAVNESAAPRLIKKDRPNPPISTLPLRLVSEPVDEPLIVPFIPPEPSPEEKTNTETFTLKITAAPPVPILSPKIIRRSRHRQDKALYRKRFTLPAAVDHDSEPETVSSTDHVHSLTFHWSKQLDTLMQTAENQIQMLADHLLVQSSQGLKTICFKSVLPGDGCSTILLCAVRALLERKYRILLVDVHHQHLDLPKQLNLSENAHIGNDVMTLNESLSLWAWQESNTPEENKTALTTILNTNKEKFDLVLLDHGSVTESPLSELIDFWNDIALDGILLIANTKRPSEVPVSHIAGRLRQHHIHLIGIAENYV